MCLVVLSIFLLCVYVDVNVIILNFKELGASLDPCSDTFSGLEAFSEPETQAIRDTILAIKPDLYLTLHSYGPVVFKTFFLFI